MGERMARRVLLVGWSGDWNLCEPLLDRGLMPAGALFAGVVAHLVGAPLAVTSMGAIVVVLTLLVAWRVPHIRKLQS